jgi:hypothetical protein
MHEWPGPSTWSRRLSDEHRTLGADWARAAERPGRQELSGLGRRLADHLAEEERHVHRLVRQHFPDTLDVVRDERATFLSLLELLDRRLVGAPHDVDPSVSVIVLDIEQLWQAHVRRFESVIGPVLRQIHGGRLSP